MLGPFVKKINKTFPWARAVTFFLLLLNLTWILHSNLMHIFTVLFECLFFNLTFDRLPKWANKRTGEN